MRGAATEKARARLESEQRARTWINGGIPSSTSRRQRGRGEGSPRWDHGRMTGGGRKRRERSKAERSGTERSTVTGSTAPASYFVVPRLIAFQNGSVQNRLDDPPFVLSFSPSKLVGKRPVGIFTGVNPDKLNRTAFRRFESATFRNDARSTALSATMSSIYGFT